MMRYPKLKILWMESNKIAKNSKKMLFFQKKEISPNCGLDISLVGKGDFRRERERERKKVNNFKYSSNICLFLFICLFVCFDKVMYCHPIGLGAHYVAGLKV